MKIFVLAGSPHRNGTSALLADRLTAGMRDAGHEVFRFDAAFGRVQPCIGCDKCECGSRPYIQFAKIQKRKGRRLPVQLQRSLYTSALKMGMAIRHDF